MTSPYKNHQHRSISKSDLFRSTALASAAGMLMVFGVAIAPERADAACTINGAPSSTGGRVLVPDGGSVDCPDGSTTQQAFDGRPAGSEDANGYTFDLGDSATLKMPTPATASSNAVIIAGPKSAITLGANSVTESLRDSEAIRVSGDSPTIQIEKGASVIAEYEAIQGNRRLHEAVGLKVLNYGLIETRGTGTDAVIRTGDNAEVVNFGTIRRTTTFGAPLLSTGRVQGLQLFENSYLDNKGTIEAILSPLDEPGLLSVVEGLGSTDIFNSGTIRADGRGKGPENSGVAVELSSGENWLINKVGGVIDGRDAALAILTRGGDDDFVDNAGQIIGGSEGAINALGENFSLTHQASGSIEGDVQVYQIDRVLPNPPKTFPGAPDICKGTNQASFCFDRYNRRPDKATLTFETGKDVTVDPAVTEYFGFSDIVVDGAGTVELSQDFRRATRELRVQGQPSKLPDGHFNESLTFTTTNTADPSKPGQIIYSGAIGDSMDGKLLANVIKNGPGTLRLTGDSTASGGFRINDGLAVVEGKIATPTAVESGARITGSGEVASIVSVKSGATIGSDGVFTVGALLTQTGSTIQIDAIETGDTLIADRIDVTNAAKFEQGTIVDVVFDASDKLPALSGINIVAAEGGVRGFAPRIVLDPASLPRGQNFGLDLEATNGGGTFATPGQAIPAGAGGAGVIVLKIESHDQIPTPTTQVAIINKPTQLTPSLTQPMPVILAPPLQTPLVPPLQPTAISYLVPALVKGPTAQVTTPLVVTPPTGTLPPTGTPPKAGFVVTNNGGAQVGGAVIPTPMTNTGTLVAPNKTPIGTSTAVVTVTPTVTAPTNVVGVTGTYARVDQKNAGKGSKHVLVYNPNTVHVVNIPDNHGNLAVLGVTQTKTQQQVGQAVSSTLPKPHERPKNPDQGSFVQGLYPLTLSQINPALNSIAGENEDPTFVAVLDTRAFQDAMDSRLRDRRDGRVSFGTDVTQNFGGPSTDRAAWGEFVGRYADGDYLNNADISTRGIMLGVDQTVAENTIAGLALSYSDSSIDAKTGSSDTVRSFEIAAYVDYSYGDWFANGSIGFGRSKLEMDRAAITGSTSSILSGKSDANIFFAGIEGGKTFKTSWGAIEPTVGLRYQYVDRDGYSERGNSSLARNVAGVTLNSGQGVIGLRGYGVSKETDGISWRPELRIAYARELGDSDIDGSASLASAPGSSFDVFTAGPGKDIGILGLRLEGKGDGMDFFVDYQAEVREDLFGHRLSLGLSMYF